MRRLSLILLVFQLAAAVASSLRAADAMAWKQRAGVRAPSGNLYLVCRWQPADGLRFRVAPRDATNHVEVVLSPAASAATARPAAGRAARSAAAALFFDAALPAAAPQQVAVTLAFRPATWTLYVDGAPAAELPAPFQPPARVLEPLSQVPADLDAADEPRFQKVRPFRFQDAFLKPPEEGGSLPGWETLGGSWKPHTAIDSSVERGDLKARGSKLPKPEHSPNFCALQASGTGAVLLAGHDFYADYSHESAIRLAEGEMGLVFYHRPDAGCYGFTARLEPGGGEVALALWRAAPDNLRRRTCLARVAVPSLAGQWHKLGVAVQRRHIECYFDDTPVIRDTQPLPPGGRFGLYVNADEPVRFDDVLARTTPRLMLRTEADLAHYELLRSSTIRYGGAQKAEDTPVLDAPSAAVPQTMILGSPTHPPHFFSARFLPAQSRFSVGLLAGYTDAARPHYRFTFTRGPAGDLVRLVEVHTNMTRFVDHVLFDPPPHPKPAPLRLTADASEPGSLRLYVDDRLALVHYPERSPAGASGFCLGPGTAARIDRLSYEFERGDLRHNRFEKNRIFVNDRYMRHWSSPEGDWLPMPGGDVWHKSDFFGRFSLHMPFVPGSTIHLGATDRQSNGSHMVVSLPDTVVLAESGAGASNAAPRARVAVSNLARQAVAPAGASGEEAPPPGAFFTLHNEGHWLWLTSGGRLLAKHFLPQPLLGTRIRLTGYQIDQLAHSRVERFNVQDYLFTRSPHEWTLNGGQWDVVNRFQCQPRWSHMNGESAEGLAALWSKLRYGGDFCAEMYVGLRHRWYTRPGDLNLTVLNRRNTPSEGYTVTCTGWDPDHSQLFTRLYREGQERAVSDKYLVPRVRENKRRHGYTPLIADGRDLHGAWYYIKLRRIGGRIEYYFDNERVFALEDEDPLESGSMGIWTYRNSMMVARVKIAAQRIEPVPVPFRRLPPSWAPPAPAVRPAPAPALNINGQALGAAAQALWKEDDSVSRCRLSWDREPGAAPHFTVRNVLGSGSMAVRCNLPPMRIQQLAGWRFEFRRTPGAQVNFHYSAGFVEKGKYVNKALYVHRLSGPRDERSACHITGATQVPAGPAPEQEGGATGPWTSVECRLPVYELLRLAPNWGTNIWVKVQGFGILQPSFASQGLSGNAPGESYAVRDFTVIRNGPPRLEARDDTNAVASLTLACPGERRRAFDNLSELQAFLDTRTNRAVETAVLGYRSPVGAARHELAWHNPPARPRISCAWSPDTPYGVELRSSPPADWRLITSAMRIGDTPVPLRRGRDGALIGLLPRRAGLRQERGDALPVQVSVGDTVYADRLAWRDCTAVQPPALLSLDGLTGFLETFETQTDGAPLLLNRRRADAGDADPSALSRQVLPRTEEPVAARGKAARLGVAHFEPERGRCLEVDNRGLSSRLKAGFSVPFSLSHYPLLQFRYRGQGMVNVSLALDNQVVRLSENHPPARSVRHGSPLVLDDNWHTWLGAICDAARASLADRHIYRLDRIRFGSFHRTDQTGLYSRWRLDDIVAGPAVRAAEALIFKPHYFEFRGVDCVYMALYQGTQPYDRLPPERRAALTWRRVANREAVRPDIGELSDGVCHLLLKAQGRGGLESGVTDIPFLLDRQPLQVSHRFEEKAPPGGVKRLLLAFATEGGAPLDTANLSVSWDGHPAPAKNPFASFNHHADRTTAALDWAYLFREHLDRGTNGQVCALVVTNIFDGAGNASPPLAVPIRIDYDADDTPPAIAAIRYPKNILLAADWFGRNQSRLQFRPAMGDSVTLKQPPREAPYLETATARTAGMITCRLPAKWLLTKHPYLSFRVRRPWAGERDKTKLDLILDLGGQRYTIGLNHGAKGKRHVPLPEPLAPRSNTWQAVTLNLAALLEGVAQPRLIEKRGVRSISLRRQAARVKQPLHLQSMFLHAAWRPEHAVRLDAYDGSGMAGTLVNCIRLEGTDTPWLVVQAQDRAGNLTPPIHIPAGPAPAPRPAGRDGQEKGPTP